MRDPRAYQEVAVGYQPWCIYPSISPSQYTYEARISVSGYDREIFVVFYPANTYPNRKVKGGVRMVVETELER